MSLFCFARVITFVYFKWWKERPRDGVERNVPLSDSLCVFVFSFSADIFE